LLLRFCFLGVNKAANHEAFYDSYCDHCPSNAYTFFAGLVGILRCNRSQAARKRPAGSSYSPVHISSILFVNHAYGIATKDFNLYISSPWYLKRRPISRAS
jgi:hypothetical protein